MKNLFLDLDGTIIDSSRRQFAVLKEIARFADQLSYKEFWELKRKGISSYEILKYKVDGFDMGRATLRKLWMDEIEQHKYMDLDRLQPNADDVMRKASVRSEIYIVTGRQDGPFTQLQMERLNLSRLVRFIMCTGSKVSKSELVRNYKVGVTSKDRFVGDSEEDMTAASELGVEGILVENGATDISMLKLEKDVRVVKSIAQFGDLFL